MHHSSEDTSRRGFLREFGAGTLGAMALAAGQSPAAQPEPAKPVSDRKIRMAVVGHGVCRFGASLGFQHHPNVEIVAVSDLVPDRRADLAKACACEKTYESLEVLVKDPAIEAVCLATDAPSHARHAVEVLKHGKHCVTAVPAAMSLDDCQAVKEAKEKSGLKYMMAETSYYHGEVIRSRNLYRLGEKLLYTEGHYYHHGVTRLGSWKDWRRALPPMYYPTHSTAYYVGVTGKRLTQVSCLGFRVPGEEWEKNNWENNPFVNEAALFRTSEETMCRINVFWWGASAGGESGSWIWEKKPTAQVPNTVPLPKSVPRGGHGGSHGPLANEFVMALLEDREPAIDVYEALAMVAPGIVAHQSALKGGAQLAIPSFDKP